MINIPFMQGFQNNINVPSSTKLQLNINSNINYSNIPTELLNNLTYINIANGITLTIDINTILPQNIIEISGNGTLLINQGISLTLQSNLTLSVSNINIKGNLNIPQNSTITLNVLGNLTTNSNKGNLIVNGTLYWLQSNILPTGTISSVPSFPLNISGTGIMIAGYNFQSNATNETTFSSTSIPPNTTYGGNYASESGYGYYNLSQIKGSSSGIYCIGVANGNNYYANALIYIGKANTVYNVSTSYYWSNYYDPLTGLFISAVNLSGSAGTIYLTGYLMV